MRPLSASRMFLTRFMTSLAFRLVSLFDVEDGLRELDVLAVLLELDRLQGERREGRAADVLQVAERVAEDGSHRPCAGLELEATQVGVVLQPERDLDVRLADVTLLVVLSAGRVVAILTDVRLTALRLEGGTTTDEE